MIWLKNIWSEFISSQACRRLTAATFVLYCILITTFLWIAPQLSPQIPLYYSLPKGGEQLGTPTQVQQILIGTGILILLDVIIAILIARSWRNLTLIMLWSAFMVVVLLSFTLLRIYLLVT